RLALRYARRGIERSGADSAASGRAEELEGGTMRAARRPPGSWPAGFVCAAGLVAAGCMHEPLMNASDDVLAAAIAVVDLTSDAAVLVGSGDIADCEHPEGAAATGTLIRRVLERSPDAIVFTTGDHAYPDGAPEEFARCYEPAW